MKERSLPLPGGCWKLPSIRLHQVAGRPQWRQRMTAVTSSGWTCTGAAAVDAARRSGAAPRGQRPGHTRLCRLVLLSGSGQGGVQLAAGADAQLGEYLAQMPFDRARGQEQLGADFRAGAAVAGQPGDLLLLGRKLAVRLDG